MKKESVDGKDVNFKKTHKDLFVISSFYIFYDLMQKWVTKRPIQYVITLSMKAIKPCFIGVY